MTARTASPSRPVKLVVFDMDSTLIQNETIDELARQKGVYEEVAAITHAAMSGQFDFDESLKRRAEKLQGLPVAELNEVLKRIQLTPGAKELCTALKAKGCKTAVLSGGFEFVARDVQKKLGLDYAFFNMLEMKSDVLTGRVIPPIVNAQRKADLLRQIAVAEGIALDQTAAVGDGANDALMLEKSGLGIAFNAKPTLEAKADVVLREKSLMSVFAVLFPSHS